MKKIILINFLILFICSGCSVNYNLKIDKNLKVTEELEATESKQFFDEYNNATTEEVIDMILEGNGIDKNSVEKVLDGKESGIKILNNYNSLEDFSIQSKYYKQYFSDIDYTNDEGKIILDLDNNIINDNNYPESFSIDKATIKIKLPFKVTNSNADKVNELTNTYTWYVYGDTESKNIHLEFDINESRFDYSVLTKYIPIVLTIAFIAFVAYIVIKIVKNKRLESNKF